MPILINDSINVAAVKPVDSRYGPYVSTAAALTAIPLYKRYKGLTIGVLTDGTGDVIDYWFKAGVANNQLVEKTTGASGGGSNTITAKSTYWTSTPGQVNFDTITGYTDADEDNYFVSVGAQEQIPNVHYTIVSNSGAGRLTLSAAPPTGTLVCVRVLKGSLDTGLSGNATKIQNVDVSATPPNNGQALVYDSDANEWKASAVSGGTGDTGDITFEGSRIKGVSSETVAGSIELLPNPHNRYSSQYLVIRPTSPNDGQHIHIDRGALASLYLGNDNQYVKLSNDADKHIEIGVPEALTSQAYTVEIASGSETWSMQLTKSTNMWALGLTNGSTITRIAPTGETITVDSVSGADPTYIYVSFTAPLVTALTVGDTLSFHYNPRKTWKFTNDGFLTFPDGTSQDTAGGGGEGSSNATQLQGRNIATTAPTDGQILTWDPETSTWVATSIVTGGSITVNTLGVTNWTVPLTARWVRVQASSGNGSAGTDGSAGTNGSQPSYNSPEGEAPFYTTGEKGSDGTDGVDGIDGKSVKIGTIVVASGGPKGLKGFGGGGGGGGGISDTVNYESGVTTYGCLASSGNAGVGADSGGGGGAATFEANGADGAAGGSGDGAAGGAGGGGAFAGGTGGTASLATRAGGGGGGGGFGSPAVGDGGVGGDGGLGTSGANGASVDIAFDLSTYAGTTIPIEITAGNGSASITISW